MRKIQVKSFTGNREIKDADDYVCDFKDIEKNIRINKGNNSFITTNKYQKTIKLWNSPSAFRNGNAVVKLELKNWKHASIILKKLEKKNWKCGNFENAKSRVFGWKIVLPNGKKVNHLIEMERR